MTIAELCRREGIADSLYYSWSKEFMEAGKCMSSNFMGQKQLKNKGDFLLLPDYMSFGTQIQSATLQ
jgi:hypothetical protein